MENFSEKDDKDDTVKNVTIISIGCSSIHKIVSMIVEDMTRVIMTIQDACVMREKTKR